MLRVIVLGFVLLLASCGAQTTGKDITVKNSFEFNNIYGSVTIAPDLATKSGDLEQTTENPTEITTPIDIVLTPAQMLTKAGEDLAAAKLLEKTTELQALTPASVAPTIPSEEPPDNDNAPVEETTPTNAYEHHDPIAIHSDYEDGRTFYRLGKPGGSWGKTILITGDETGDEFLIPDTAYNWGDREGKFFFNGNSTGPNDDALEPTFDKNASLFWQVDRSVTIHYNKET